MDSETKKRLRTGSWIACGFAAEEHKRIEIAEKVNKGDLDMVGIQLGGGVDREKKEGTEQQEYGGGGRGVPSKRKSVGHNRGD